MRSARTVTGPAGRGAIIGKRRYQRFDAADIGVETLGDDQAFGLHACHLGADGACREARRGNPVSLLSAEDSGANCKTQPPLKGEP